MGQEEWKVSQSSIAQALATDYFCIYYVNVENDRFIEYSASPEYEAFGFPKTGDDFIGFSRKRFEDYVVEEDQERFLETFTKDNVVEALDDHGKFSMTFRLILDGRPTYVYLKVTRMIEEDVRHIVIGISSVDDQMRAREAYARIHHESLTYNRVAQALAGDYFSIYVIDPDTDRFFEYNSVEEYEKLEIEKSGEDFFNLSRRNMARVIYPGDKERFLAIFTKEKIMEILERDGSFTMKYRLMFDDTPVYVSMKATLLEDEDGRHLIIGTNNIDAQMRREEDYRKRVEDAKVSAKNDFLANMSHDIRTPMNAVIGYTSIAKSHLDDPEAVSEALDKIGSSSHYLLSLINDILDISKIESGKMQLSYGTCDLGEVFRRIEDITALQAQNKSLTISYQHDSVKDLHIRADELRIEQILVNIVSNAIKYTPEGGSVELIVEEESRPGTGRNLYRFIVRDTGIGISEDYLPYIFDSFTREEGTKTNRVQGTGLGLAITAKIVEMMDGEISVKSELGKGSEFTVELVLETAEEAGSEETAEGGEIDLTGMRVLLVEDNEINAEIAVRILRQYGVSVVRAANGKEGLERVQEALTSASEPETQTDASGRFDAVLMDLQMPVMNGFEATRAIRALEGDYFRTLPIIAMSANAYDEDVRDCLEAGMNAHLAKPYQPEALVRLLQKHRI